MWSDGSCSWNCLMGSSNSILSWLWSWPTRMSSSRGVNHTCLILSKCREELGSPKPVLLELSFLQTTRTKLIKTAAHSGLDSSLSQHAYTSSWAITFSSCCLRIGWLCLQGQPNPCIHQASWASWAYLMEDSNNKVILAKGNIPARGRPFSLTFCLTLSEMGLLGAWIRSTKKILFTEATWILVFNTPNRRQITPRSEHGS